MAYQCTLWSCDEGVGHSQAHALAAEEEGNVGVLIVGGMYERRVNEVASKCLESRSVGRPCGVPFLPVEALETNPWHLSDTFFNRQLQEGEKERNWIFYGPTVKSRSLWGSCYENKVVPGFGMRRMVHYLQKGQRSKDDGMFRLTAYPVTGIQPEAFYILLFKPTVPGKSGSFRGDEDKKKETEVQVSPGEPETSSNFLQVKAKGMAKEVQHSRTGGEVTQTPEDVVEFLDKIQNDEMLGFAKLFSDELTLDNISIRPRLVSMCIKILRSKLEYLEMKAELIKKEEVLTRIKDVKGGEEDKVLQEVMTIPPARARVLVQQDDLCKLSHALGVLASASSVCREREEFLRLVKKEVDGKDVDGPMKAYKAASDEVAEADKASFALMEMVDGMIQNLENETDDDVDVKIGKGWLLLDRDRDGKVTTPDEVAAAAMYLKDTLANEGLQQLMSSLSKDKGLVKVNAWEDESRNEFLRLVKREVEGEDFDGEKAAMKAYKTAREDSDEVAEADKASSALMQMVDGMIQKLEKEIDDVKIGKGFLDRDRNGKVTPAAMCT